LGFTVDHSKVIKEKWPIITSIGYDQELSKKKNEKDSIVNTLYTTLDFGYALTRIMQ